MKKIPHYHPNLRLKQGGFVITMEAIFVGLGTMAMMTAFFGNMVLERGYEAKSQNAGGRSALINKATNTYMSTAYLVLTDSTSATEVQKMIDAGNLPAWVGTVKRIGDPAGPDYNLCPAHDCIRITTADLLAAKLLQDGTPEKDVYGNSFDIIIRRTGTNGFYDLGAIIATSGTFKRVNQGPQPNMTDLWNGVAAVGDDGAITHIATASDVSGGYTGSVGDVAAFGVADKETRKVGWFAKASDWPNIKAEGQLVTRAGYLSSAWASYARLDGTKPFTGPPNFGGNVLRNLAGKKPNDPCTAAEVGDVGVVTATTTYGASGEGVGLLLTCSFNGLDYRWGKATSGAMTVADGKAGMMDGYETNAAWTCWSLQGGEPGNVMDPGGIGLQYVKFVMSGGRGWAYGKRNDGSWQNISRDPVGYDIDSVWAWDSPVPFYFPVPVVEGGVYTCKRAAQDPDPARDPNFEVLMGWYFTPNGITFSAQGSWKKAVENGGGVAEDLSGIPVNVPTSTVSCDSVTGLCSSTTGSQTVYTQPRGNKPYVTKPFFMNTIWSWQKRSTCTPTKPLNIGYGDVCS